MMASGRMMIAAASIVIVVAGLIGYQQGTQCGDLGLDALRLGDLCWGRRRSGCGLDLGQMLERHDAVRVLVCLRKLPMSAEITTPSPCR